MKSPQSTSWPSSLRAGHTELVFWLGAALLAAVVIVAYVPRFPWYGQYSAVVGFWPELTHRPFVYRVLLPLLAEAGRRIVPAEPELYFSMILYLSLVGFVVALHRLAHLFWKPSRHLDYLVLASIPLIIPLSVYHQHLYDLTMLCLFTWGIVLIAQRRWTAFLVVYAIACFNKETTIFLTGIFFAIHYRDLAQKIYQRLLAMQLSIYILIRAALMFIFREQPGGVVEYHLHDHLSSYVNDPFRSLVYLTAILIVTALVAYRFQSKPRFLRTTLVAVFPLMLILFLLFGFPYETRVFYEIYGPILLLCVPPQLFKARQPQSPAP